VKLKHILIGLGIFLVFWIGHDPEAAGQAVRAAIGGLFGWGGNAADFTTEVSK
jgi:hypothetical protein